MHRSAHQKAGFAGCRERSRIGASAIGADPVRGEQRLILQRLAEEALGSIEVALGRQQEVDWVPVLVDGPVQIAPLAADLDVCLVDPDRAAMGFAEGAQPALDQRRVGQDVARGSSVVKLHEGAPSWSPLRRGPGGRMDSRLARLGRAVAFVLRRRGGPRWAAPSVTG